jgi:glutamine synthetase
LNGTILQRHRKAYRINSFIISAPHTGMFGYSILRRIEIGFMNDLFSLLQGFGIPLEGLHTETGPGT